MDNNINIEKNINQTRKSAENTVFYSALTLAYLGDCIYELYVRTHLTENGNHKVNELHKEATEFVCAAAQAKFYHKIADILTEDELAAFKRGRNAKSHPPKNANMSDYKIATGVEALLGQLYLDGKSERISELMTRLFVD